MNKLLGAMLASNAIGVSKKTIHDLEMAMRRGPGIPRWANITRRMTRHWSKQHSGRVYLPERKKLKGGREVMFFAGTQTAYLPLKSGWRRLHLEREPAKEEVDTRRWQSCSKWPVGVYSGYRGRRVLRINYPTRTQAESLCEHLRLGGFGFAGNDFPLRTWVEPVTEQQEAAAK